MQRKGFLLGAALAAAALGSTVLAAGVKRQPAAGRPESVSDDGEWQSLLDSLRPIAAEALARAPGADDPRLRDMVHQQLLGALVQAFHSWLIDDPRQPRFQPGINVAANLAAPNADTIYHYAAIDGRGTYRLTGKRGTSRLVNLSMGPFWQRTGKLPERSGNHSFEELTLGADGSFSVLLSPERPAGYAGDWWQLDPKVAALGLREVLYDWNREEPLRIAIERLDIPSPITPRTSAEVRERMGELSQWVRGESLMWFDHVHTLLARAPANTLASEDYGTSGVPAQNYYEGIFDVTDSDALIIEAKPPAQCFYWSILLADLAFATVDWVNYQSSLNGTQAHLDKDGVFRAVLSLKDPGVPNWLDPAGRRRGVIQGRWTRCPGATTPIVKKVPLAQLREHLPADTPIISLAQRDERLRARRVAAQLKGIGF